MSFIHLQFCSQKNTDAQYCCICVYKAYIYGLKRTSYNSTQDIKVQKKISNKHIRHTQRDYTTDIE